MVGCLSERRAHCRQAAGGASAERGASSSALAAAAPSRLSRRLTTATSAALCSEPYDTGSLTLQTSQLS